MDMENLSTVEMDSSNNTGHKSALGSSAESGSMAIPPSIEYPISQFTSI